MGSRVIGVGVTFVWVTACGSVDSGDTGRADAADHRDGDVDASNTVDAGADASTTEVTIFDDASILDTELRQIDPTKNYGELNRACADLPPDGRTVLLHVDASAIPASAQVISAEFHLWTGTDSTDASPDKNYVYEVFEAWQEGNQNGSAGQASWNERSPGMAWTTPGAGSGSRADVPAGVFTPSALDTEYVIPLDLGLVESWIANPAANYGIAIVLGAGVNGACFVTSEGLATKRPWLQVTWR